MLKWRLAINQLVQDFTQAYDNDNALKHFSQNPPDIGLAFGIL